MPFNLDFAGCEVMLVDNRVHMDRFIDNDGGDAESIATALFMEQPGVQGQVKALLKYFKRGVNLCNSADACLSKLHKQGLQSQNSPILVFVALHYTCGGASKTEAPNSFPSQQHLQQHHSPDPEQMAFLQHLCSQKRSSPSTFALMVPVVIARLEDARGNDVAAAAAATATPDAAPGAWKAGALLECVEAGAADVLFEPFTDAKSEAGGEGEFAKLEVSAIRAFLEGARARRAHIYLSQPLGQAEVQKKAERYDYLGITVVNDLSKGLDPHEKIRFPSETYEITPEREKELWRAATSWDFNGHNYSRNELVHQVFMMIDHAQSHPKLQDYRIAKEDLKKFVMVVRSYYQDVALYHNFVHATDVTQAVFFFLLQIHALPSPEGFRALEGFDEKMTPLGELVQPVDAFMLLISALGHDVGHPGVNNAFLVAIRSPLARLYNDTSVLEAYHCSKYSQILGSFWGKIVESPKARSPLIKNILATDMAMHSKYMDDLGHLLTQFHDNGSTTMGWNDKTCDTYRELICCLLIKCADISNVTRFRDTSIAWTDWLQLEFDKQAQMEREIGMAESTLAGGPPELGNRQKLATSQGNFMDFVAHKLFEEIAQILPGMRFAYSTLLENREFWRTVFEQEKEAAEGPQSDDRHSMEGTHSPRSGSPHRMFSSMESERPSDAGGGFVRGDFPDTQPHLSSSNPMGEVGRPVPGADVTNLSPAPRPHTAPTAGRRGAENAPPVPPPLSNPKYYSGGGGQPQSPNSARQSFPRSLGGSATNPASPNSATDDTNPPSSTETSVLTSTHDSSVGTSAAATNSASFQRNGMLGSGVTSSSSVTPTQSPPAAELAPNNASGGGSGPGGSRKLRNRRSRLSIRQFFGLKKKDSNKGQDQQQQQQQDQQQVAGMTMLGSQMSAPQIAGFQQGQPGQGFQHQQQQNGRPMSAVLGR